jgi:hypothetical protein
MVSVEWLEKEFSAVSGVFGLWQQLSPSGKEKDWKGGTRVNHKVSEIDSTHAGEANV